MINQFFQVTLRLRKQLPNEDSIAWTAQQNKLMSVCTFDANDLVNVQSRDRKRALQCEIMEPQQFIYDTVETESKTQSLYVKLCRSLIKQSLTGYHVTIMCYGQTTSGKTYTMLGDFNNPGIIPCAIRDIFNWKQNEDFTVLIQYLQIYNEQLDDLLSNTSKPSIIDDSKWGTTVTGTEKIKLNSFEEAMNLINKGEQNRIYKATKIHEHSSRSHTLLKLITYACINLIDLAGSERLSDADTSCQNETGYINKSLFALTNVIKKLAEKNKHIPFRDSKLTRLLTDSLGGNSNTLMICCVSPAKKNFFQTLSTLKFANLAKLIKNNPHQGVIYDAEDVTEIQQLQNELKQAKQRIKTLNEENNQYQQLIRKLEEQIQNTSQIQTHQSQSNFDHNFIGAQGSVLNFSDILSLYDQLPFDQEALQKIRHIEGDYRQNLRREQSDLCQKLNQISVKDQNIQKLIWLIQTQLKVQDLMQRDWNEFIHIDDILDKIQLPTQKQDFFLQLEKIEQQTILVLQTLYQEAKISNIVETSRKKQLESIFGINVFNNEDQNYLERQFKNAIDHLRQIKNMITDVIKQQSKSTINAETIQLIKQKQREPLKQLNQDVLTQSTKQENSRQSSSQYQNKQTKSNISVSSFSTPWKEYQTILWGSNQDGRLGVGKNVQIARKPMSLKKKFSQISCGSHHTVGITAEGQIYSWGRGLKGQLGLGNYENINEPQRIELEWPIIQVASGWQHTICLDQQGYIYSWGYGEDGQLGLGDLKNHNTPQMINQQFETVSIWAGHSTSAFLTSEDELYCFGSNWDGRCMSDKLGILAYPELIMKNQLRSLSLGVSHMGVVLNDGSLVMSGIGTEGQLGTLLDELQQKKTNPYVFKIERASEDLGGNEEQITYDVDLATPCIYVDKFSQGGCIQVACGDRFTLVLTENERVYSFGKNSYCRLGLNTQENIYEPTIIMTLKDAGFRHGGVVSKDSELYMWGFNFHNQIGLGQNDEDQVFPLKVIEKVEQVSLGYFHSAALLKE